MTRAPLVATLALALATAGCGFGLWEEDPGGAVNLPIAAAGPYGRLARDSETPAEEPFLIADRLGVYRDPAALPRADGGVRLWFGMDLEADPAGSRIGRAELPSLHDLPDVAPTVALAPLEAWEGDRLAAPAVIELGGGRLVMFYEGGDAPAIGRADSDDDGATWQRQSAPVLVDAAAPTVALVDDELVLFVTVPGRVGIFRTDAFAIDPPGLTPTLRVEPVVVPRPGVAEAFDAAAVFDPFILVEVTPTGRLLWNLWFAGAAEVTDAGPPATSIGHAGSFDGEGWARLPGPDPMLSRPAGGPSVLLYGPSAVMFFHEDQRLRLGVAAATHP